MLDVLRLLWSARDFRGRVVIAYTAIIVSAAVGGLTPLVLGWAIDAALRGDYQATGGLAAFNCVWGLLFWLRMRLDTRGLEGAVTAATVTYAERAHAAGVPAGEIVNNVQSTDAVLSVLRGSLCQIAGVGAYCAVGLVSLTVQHWSLGVMAVAYLAASAVFCREIGRRSNRIANLATKTKDGLLGDITDGTPARTLNRGFRLTVAASDLDAAAWALQTGAGDMMKAATVLILAASGRSAGEIVTALAFVRAIDGMADVILVLVQQTTRAAIVAKRMAA